MQLPYITSNDTDRPTQTRWIAAVGLLFILTVSSAVAQDLKWNSFEFPGSIADMSLVRLEVWAIGFSDTVFRRDSETRTWVPEYTPPVGGIRSAGQRQQLFVTDDHTMWIRTSRDSIGAIGPRPARFEYCESCALSVDADGRAWRANAKSLDVRGDSVWRSYDLPPAMNLRLNVESVLAADSSGGIWTIGVSPNGVRHLVSLKEGTFRSAPINLVNENNIGRFLVPEMLAKINDIEAGADGTIWMATGGGLIKYRNGVFTGIADIPYSNHPGRNWAAPATRLAVDREGFVMFTTASEVAFLSNGKLHTFWGGNSTLLEGVYRAVAVTHGRWTFAGANGVFAAMNTQDWEFVRPVNAQSSDGTIEGDLKFVEDHVQRIEKLVTAWAKGDQSAASTLAQTSQEGGEVYDRLKKSRLTKKQQQKYDSLIARLGAATRKAAAQAER